MADHDDFDEGPGGAEIQVDGDAHRVRLSFNGTLGLADLMAVISRIAGMDGYEPGMDALYDLRQATFTFGHVDVQELREWAEGSFGVWGTDWRLAAVADSDLMFGYSRMMESWFTDAPWDVRSFRDLESAIAWLEEGGRRG